LGVSIPIIIFLAVIGLIVGKSVKDLNDLAVTARTSLQPLLKDAQTGAEEAKKVALAAQEETGKVRDSVGTMRQGTVHDKIILGIADRHVILVL
jgi:hypothetical protein